MSEFNLFTKRIQQPTQGGPATITATEIQSVKTADLPGLHLFGAPSEGHIGVTGAGAVPLLLLDVVDESVGLAVFPLAAPVVKDLLDELIVLLQEQFGLWKAHQLRNTDRSYILINKMDSHSGDGYLLWRAFTLTPSYHKKGFKFALPTI